MRIDPQTLLHDAMAFDGRVTGQSKDAVRPENKTEDQVALIWSKARIQEQADVRRDRVEAVKERIAQGFYDRLDVREQIADRFLATNLV